MKIIGSTDEQTDCDLCGKTNLMTTVIIGSVEGVEIGRYGTSCASKVLGMKITSHDAKKVETHRRYFRDEAARSVVKSARANNHNAIPALMREIQTLCLSDAEFQTVKAWCKSKSAQNGTL